MSVRTTVVGSWWPLPELEADLKRYHAGELSDADGVAVLNRAAETAIREQRDLGLDEWTGGEYFTDNFIMHMYRVLSGIEVDKPEEDDPFDYDDQTHARVVGEIAAPNGLGYADAYRRESALHGGVSKAAVVSPFEVAVASIDQIAEIQRQLPSLTAIVNAELRAIADAGCPDVQLDAPIFGVQINAGAMTAEQAANIIAPCFEGVHATKSLHICNGNMRGRPMSGVLSCAKWVEILQRLDGVVDVAVFECKYFSEWLERSAFKDMPKSMVLAAGIVDEGSYWVEPVKKIRDRAADWARVVGEERLWIAPSCGFGRHPARDIPVLCAKVENMVEAARTL
jgi:5-methyltetrahydropteroyltriglutamate--homocysteine methyltransferase